MKDKHSIKLLLLEDNETFAHMFSRRLRHEGFHIDIAPDGVQGLSMMEKESYDALVVDHALPGYSGLDVIRMLKEKDSLPPTIMLTSTGSESLSVEALKLGVDDYVVKDANLVCLKIFPVILNRVLLRHEEARQELQRQQQIREDREFLEKVVRLMGPDILLVVSREGYIRKANHIAGEWLGFETSELIGRQCELYLKIFDTDNTKKTPGNGWKNLLSQSGQSERKGELIIRNGVSEPVQVEITVISPREGAILRIKTPSSAGVGNEGVNMAHQRCHDAEVCLEAAIDRLANWSQAVQEVVGLKEEIRTTFESQIKGPLEIIMDFSTRLLESELQKEQRHNVEKLLASCREIHDAIEQTTTRLQTS